ncbi:MAG: hypothetical protein KAG26_00850 [Methylococcales bacterium]|nr:hypothetical protein [Methylococcales bacterium]
MKTLNYRVLFILISVFLLQSACSNQKPIIIKNPYPQLSNTTWHYIDTDWEYDMEFLSNGVLRTQHPNDKTPNNDKWLQNGNKVSFSFNNGYSNYEGKFSGNDIISGTAESKTGVIWNWKAIRVKK